MAGTGSAYDSAMASDLGALYGTSTRIGDISDEGVPPAAQREISSLVAPSNRPVTADVEPPHHWLNHGHSSWSPERSSIDRGVHSNERPAFRQHFIS